MKPTNAERWDFLARRVCGIGFSHYKVPRCSLVVYNGGIWTGHTITRAIDAAMKWVDEEKTK